jgi:endonuclease/exonuclease/phosphatase (EEP) superfamily protein YafD
MNTRPRSTQLRANKELSRWCWWVGRQDISDSGWSKLELLGKQSGIKRIVKLETVRQPNGVSRIDMYGKNSHLERIARKINTYGYHKWGWYTRKHIPYSERKRKSPQLPTRTASKQRLLQVVTYNINGIKTHKIELERFLAQDRVDILLLQETRLTTLDSQLKIGGYTLFNAPAKTENAHADRGLAIGVRSNLHAYTISEVSTPGCLAVRCTPTNKTSFIVVCVYVPVYKKGKGKGHQHEDWQEIPTRSAVLENIRKSIQQLLRKFPAETIILGGDWNTETKRLQRLISGLTHPWENHPKWAPNVTIQPLNQGLGTRRTAKPKAIDHFVTINSGLLDIKPPRRFNWDASDHYALMLPVYLSNEPTSQPTPKVDTSVPWKIRIPTKPHLPLGHNVANHQALKNRFHIFRRQRNNKPSCRKCTDTLHPSYLLLAFSFTGRN